MDQARTIGDKLRGARKRRGLTQRDLARLSGLSLSLIRKLEQDERNDICVETARKLAASLGVPTTSGSGRPSPPTHDHHPRYVQSGRRAPPPAGSCRRSRAQTVSRLARQS
jgi:transcriptional regulator with XRE-family HTH domain